MLETQNQTERTNDSWKTENHNSMATKAHTEAPSDANDGGGGSGKPHGTDLSQESFSSSNDHRAEYLQENKSAEATASPEPEMWNSHSPKEGLREPAAPKSGRDSNDT
jgi:hypothetical protein